MLFGKLIAWNKDLDRGIIEDRMGCTWKLERMSIVDDVDVIKVGTEVCFETMDNYREAYMVRSNAGEFRRYSRGEY